ncbi:hypothetical protein OESDEN_25602 [Oesophagostomum dentatum]|uniref:Uncharacterized protein n=1 Tax=Oesophagostomum dentatum TaxID=61180 RepID=A0A0B1RUD4_OESDE|nr:hypothetical protein OESDEN_25602 [Oesophagostomum dentatum]
MLADTTTTRRPSRPPFGDDDSGRGGSGRTSSFGGGSSGSSGGCPNSLDAYALSTAIRSLICSLVPPFMLYLVGKFSRQTYRINELFTTAPPRVEAAVFNPISGMMLLFSNRQVYGYYYSRLRGMFQLDPGYPKATTL